jgi:hypothetical protein
MEARIIKLEPETEIQGVSFEEAFGEHSEARGGRARRQARRAERKAKGGNRFGRLALAVATGGLVGGAIKTGPEARAARQKRRLERIARRGERQEARQELRQSRKDTRASRKEARKRMGDDPESENESNDMSQGASMEQSSDSYSQPSQPSYSEEPQYEESYNEPSQEEPQYEEEVAEEPLGDNSEYSDEESSFDAETSGETSSFDAETSDASGKKIGKKFGSRLSAMKLKITKHEDAANKLKAALRSGKLPSNMVAKGAKELKARVEHLNKMKEMHSKAVARMKSLTPVQSDLGATIGANKIVVPAKGADGEDSSMLEGDEMSSFDGKTFFAKNKGIIIGLGAAAVIIFALHKAKVFK